MSISNAASRRAPLADMTVPTQPSIQACGQAIIMGHGEGSCCRHCDSARALACQGRGSRACEHPGGAAGSLEPEMAVIPLTMCFHKSRGLLTTILGG